MCEVDIYHPVLLERLLAVLDTCNEAKPHVIVPVEIRRGLALLCFVFTLPRSTFGLVLGSVADVAITRLATREEKAVKAGGIDEKCTSGSSGVEPHCLFRCHVALPCSWRCGS